MGNISMTIVDIRGDKVRVGIEDPRNPRPSAGGQRRDQSRANPAGRALREPAGRPAGVHRRQFLERMTKMAVLPLSPALDPEIIRKDFPILAQAFE